jgi:predicted transcriptional regulator
MERLAKTPAQSAAIDRQIDALLLRGALQTEIAKTLGISNAAVSQRLKRMRQRHLANRDEALARELLALDYVQREAIEAWETSKAAHETTTVERANGRERVAKRTETATGEAAHLANVIKVSESRRKLLGLDAAAKSMLDGTVNHIHAFTQALETAYANPPEPTTEP